MSQLDISISFSHFFGLLFSFYLFIYIISFMIINFWYNYKFRFLLLKKQNLLKNEVNNNVFLKKILKI